MSTSAGSSVLIGKINNEPEGTLAEVIKEGLNPKMVASCHPETRDVKGCRNYHNCIFALTANGGFRDSGPRKIGYYHKTHEGVEVENHSTCAWFMQHMFDRMEDGIRDRRRGLQGEIIEIIAQEGEMVLRRAMVNINEGTAQPTKFEVKRFAEPVPRFVRLGERPVVTVEHEIRERRKQRLAQDRSLDTGPRRVDPAAIQPDEERALVAAAEAEAAEKAQAEIAAKLNAPIDATASAVPVRKGAR